MSFIVLPPEADSRNVTRFSFLVYGDTRGRKDGVALQYEHSLVVDSMIAEIKRLRVTQYPVRFVLQSGDAAAKRTLINAHPDLAGKLALAKSLTAESTSEQAGAGLDREWVGQTVRAVAQWIPDRELPLLARLGGIARAINTPR